MDDLSEFNPFNFILNDMCTGKSDEIEYAGYELDDERVEQGIESVRKEADALFKGHEEYCTTAFLQDFWKEYDDVWENCQSVAETNMYIHGCLYLRFKLAIRVHTKRFPEKLGYMFHKSRFKTCCQMYGNERMKQVKKEVLENADEKLRNDDIGLQDIVVLAASDKSKVSPDGVYALIRMNSASLLDKEKSQSARRMERMNQKEVEGKAKRKRNAEETTPGGKRYPPKRFRRMMADILVRQRGPQESEEDQSDEEGRK